jgi:hypothetical protein
VFLLYVLIHLLQRKQPVALQLRPEYYFLFTEHSVSTHDAGDERPLDELSESGVIALSNSSDAVTLPALALGLG